MGRFMTDKSQKYIETVEKIKDLVKTDGLDAAGRAYAEATSEQLKKDYAESRGLKPTTGRVDLCRLIGRQVKGHPSLGAGWYSGRWIDHPSLWIKNGKPDVFISQPYHLSLEDMAQLISICNEFGLEATVSTWPGWHFPGAVLSVQVRKKAQQEGDGH